MRYKCAVGRIPEVNEMLRQIAKKVGIDTSYSEEYHDAEYPHILFDTKNSYLSQCTSNYEAVDKELPLVEFIQLLKDSGIKKTTFAGHCVTLNKEKLIVGCHHFTIDEVKEFMKFLNENIK